MTGGAGRDTWDFNDVADSPAGATRDLVTDFAPSQEFPGRRGVAGWWTWSDGKRALEWLFWTGQITTATRRGFERDHYDVISERYALALAAGAQPVRSREIVTLLTAAGLRRRRRSRLAPPSAGRADERPS